jgi:hypothetical protein
MSETELVLRLGTIVLGADDPARAAAFWANALGFDIVAFPAADDEFTILLPRNGDGTRLAVHRSAALVQERPRVHLDLVVDSAEEQSPISTGSKHSAHGACRGTTPPTRTSSCSPTPKAIGSASSTPATADERRTTASRRTEQVVHEVLSGYPTPPTSTSDRRDRGMVADRRSSRPVGIDQRPKEHTADCPGRSDSGERGAAP